MRSVRGSVAIGTAYKRGVRSLEGKCDPTQRSATSALVLSGQRVTLVNTTALPASKSPFAATFTRMLQVPRAVALTRPVRLTVQIAGVRLV